MPKKVPKGGKPKIHPIDTRLRQFLTEVLLASEDPEAEERLTSDERAEVVDEAMHHADLFVTTAEAFLTMAIHALENAPDEEEDEEHDEGDE